MARISLVFLPISLALPQFPLLRPATDLLAMSVIGTILRNGSFYGIFLPFLYYKLSLGDTHDFYNHFCADNSQELYLQSSSLS